MSKALRSVMPSVVAAKHPTFSVVRLCEAGDWAADTEQHRGGDGYPVLVPHERQSHARTGWILIPDVTPAGRSVWLIQILDRRPSLLLLSCGDRDLSSWDAVPVFKRASELFLSGSLHEPPDIAISLRKDYACANRAGLGGGGDERNR